MPIDPLSLAIGTVVALVPLLAGLWSLQRRLARAQGEQALLQERLEHAQLSQAGLLAQLDACRAELAEVSEIKVEQQTELAGLRRENELLQQERQIAREAAQSWNQQRERNEAELRRLTAECAALAAELQENRDNQQQRLDDLQGARNELRAQFSELATKIFDEREQRFAETSQQRLGQLLDPLKERIQAFEKRVDESYQQEARERFSLSKELERLQQLNQRLGDEATNLARALKGQKTQGNWGELVLEGCWSMPAWRRGASTTLRSASRALVASAFSLTY
jgi:DNA recombination protein RmuC